MQAAPAQSKIYWLGRHSWQRVGAAPFQSPLGKLHSEGLKLLEGHGWRRVAADTADVPIFAFTTRKGANFPASGAGLPSIRQLPQQCTSALDDKRRMWECLAAAGCSDITPQTWLDVDAFLQQFGRGSGAAGSSSSTSSSVDIAAVQERAPHQPAAGNATAVAVPAAADLPQQPQQQPQQPQQQCWFLKHRHGVKGQAVYCFTDLQALLGRLNELSVRSRRDFIVQRGVPPLLLPSAGGRAFVLRAHVLLLLLPAQLAVGEAFQQSMPHSTRAFVHQDVIVLEHARRYDPGSPDRAVHISSCGSAHPQPYLLPQLGLAGSGSGSGASNSSLGGRQGPGGRLDEQEVAGLLFSPRQASVEQPGVGGFIPTQTPLQEEQLQQRQPPPQPQPEQPQLGTELQRRLWAQICSAASASLRAGAAGGLLPAAADPAATLYQLFGYDFAVDPGGRAWLLEVNSHPAVASGTMRLVERAIYDRLVRDLLGLVVLLATDGSPPAPGGFVEVPLAAG